MPQGVEGVGRGGHGGVAGHSLSRSTAEVTGCVVDRVGEIVILTAANITLNGGVRRTLGTLPDGFRPRSTAYGAIEYGGSSGYVEVTPAGAVYATAASGGDYSGQVVYAVA